MTYEVKAPDDGAGNATIGWSEQADVADNWGEGGSVIFHAGHDANHEQAPAQLELRSNGEIRVNGCLAATDQEVIDGFRQWLNEARLVRNYAIRDRKQELIEALEHELALEFPGPQSTWWAERLADVAINTWTAMQTKEE